MKRDRINIAHEAPLSIMPLVQRVTDYDYALACEFNKIPGYYDFFVDAKKKGRWVLLDNGIFEEGVAMEAGQFANWITNLLPNEYIVPDVLENGQKTMEQFESWLRDYGDIPGRKIGVAQGKDLKELIECYKFMSAKADKIAISFDYSLYINEIYPQVPAPNKWLGWMRGRIFILEYLYGLGILNSNKPHHLLGASLPKEFGIYTRMKDLANVVESLDTSNPVVYAIKKGKYPASLEQINDKISQKLKDLITTPSSDQLVVDSIHNISQFRFQNRL